MSEKKTADKEMKRDIEDLETNNLEEDTENPEIEIEKNQESEVKEEKKSEEPKEEDEALNARYLRLAADFQNYKRRIEKEKSDIYAYANEKIVVGLLDVIDNFERALDHSNGSIEGFTEGMNLIFKQLKGVLEKSGVEEITAKDEMFDPNFHHAVLTDNSVEYESGKVTQVLQKGYMLNNKVIRPAMVKVAE